ncbi:hypothetical protein BFP75_02840 [Maribacter sp. 4G9]|nr:hypothetical protein BFP75_02840 [Maribacter sp. 4G9]
MATMAAVAQIKIGDNPQNIDPSSLLELESSSRVLVISKVSTLQMETITPQRGGLVYNTDTECIHYYDGAQWVNLCDAVSFTLTNDPIENLRSTIAITQTQGNYNLEVATNSIRTEQIADGGINGVDIQDNSIGRNKLGDAAVGPDELATESVDSDAIIDRTIESRDMAIAGPIQILTTNINGIPDWQNQNELYELTFDKDSNTLTLNPATGTGSNSINLEALVGSDDQTLTLTPDNRLQIENGNEIDLSFLNNTGSDNQTIDSDNTPGNIAILNGNEITLNVNDADAEPDNELQNINEVLADGNDAGGLLIKNIGTPVDDQDAATKGYIDTEIADIVTSGGSDPINEQNQTFEVAGGELRLTDVAGTLAVPLTDIDTNTQLSDADITALGYIKTDLDEQNLAQVLAQGTDANALQIKNLLDPTDPQDAATRAYVDANAGGNQNLAQVLAQGTDANTLQIKNLLDPTDLQDAATKKYVDDNIVAAGGGVPTDELNQTFIINGLNIELTDAGGTLQIPINQINSDDQDADEVLVTAAPTNYTAGTPNVEAHLAGIDAALAAGGNPTDEIQDLDLTTDILTITNNAAATPIDLTPYLDNTDDQDAAEVAVTAAPTNYTAGTPDVEAHLAGIDAALSGGGGSIELADQTTITGDGTLGNEFTVGTIGTGEIGNGTILLEDINQNGAADGQIIKWDATANAGTGGWIVAEDRTDGTGVPTLTNATILIGDATNTPQERTISGDVTLDNTGLATITVDAITSAEVTDLSIATDDLANNSITIEKIAEGLDGQILTTNGTDVIWADNTLAVSNLATDDLTQDNEDRIYNFGANALTFLGTGTIGISQNPAFNAAAALHVDGTTLSNGFATASPLGFYFNGNLETGLHFDEFTPDLVSLTAGNIRALTVTNTAGTTNVLVPERLQLGGLVADNSNAVGTNGQVLTSTGTGVAWQDVPGSLTGVTGSIFFADATGEVSENNAQLFWDTGLNRLGIGTNTPERKLDVAGEIRGNQFSSTGGTVAEPAYSFSTGDDANTGMFRPAADEIGFAVGGVEALRMEEDGGNTNVTIFQSLTLENLLLDKDGDAGTPGQILSSTGTQTDWIDAPTGGAINTDATLTGDGQTGTPLSIADNSINSARIADGTIANEDIAANAIETANILDANVTEAKIAPGADGEVLTTAGGVATWAAPTAGAVSTDGTTITGDGNATDLSVPIGGITTGQILDGTIANADIAANAIETANILDANVTEAKIAPGADGEVLTTAGGVATWAAPTTGAVSTDGTTITGDGNATDLSVPIGGITTGQILDGTIANADIAANAIETANILDANVTEAKIAPGADGEVLTTAGGVATWAVPTAGAVSTDGTTITGDGNATDLSVPIGGISTGQILDGTIANADIAANAIETANILDANVTEAKIAPGADGEVLTTAGGVATWAAQVEWQHGRHRQQVR